MIMITAALIIAHLIVLLLLIWRDPAHLNPTRKD